MSEQLFTAKLFYDNLKEKRLMGTKCTECDALMVPPRPVCPRCGSVNLEWVEFKGEGSLETFTVIYVPPISLSEKALYVVGIVRLDEGVSIMGRIVDVDPTEPEKIELGMRMNAGAIEENGKIVLVFKPATSSSPL